MKNFIVVLSLAVGVFAGYTIWTDPIVGPKIHAMLPERIAKMPVIASISKGSSSQPTGRYGGIGAANSVAGAVVGSVSN